MVDSLMSQYPWNEKNNTFTWLSSLYNLFKGRRKTSNYFSSVNLFSLLHKENLLRIIWNTNNVKLVLYYCVIILSFLFVNCLNILPIKNEFKYWMVYTLYILKGIMRCYIWIEINRKCLLFLSHILHIILWLFLFVNKCKNKKRMNGKLNNTPHEYYYVYEAFYCRLESR